MKKKSIITTLFILTLTVLFLSDSAFAGSKERYRWEGVAIGLGAALIGGAVIHHHRTATRYEPAHVSVRHAPPPHRYREHRYKRHRGHRHRGHWEIVREWVPPTYKRIWNPGHYNRRGKWIEGHWIEILDQPGCWSERRIWVSRW